jgi:tripartite-type tricarboxylate transporter receptor subunit TctC
MIIPEAVGDASRARRQGPPSTHHDPEDTRMVMLRAAAIAVAFVFALTGSALAQNYPSKPIRILVGFAPGGAGDIITRDFGVALGQALGQPVIVENKAGANGVIATEAAAKSPPDGYTLVLAINSTVTNPLLYKGIPFDVWKDLVPVGIVANTPLVLACTPTFAPKTLRELIDYAKAKPGQVTYGSPGNGSIIQLAMELMNSKADIRMTHVPYKGGAPAMTAVVAGEVNCSWFSIAQSLPLIKAGKLRALALTVKSPPLPEVPPAADTIPGYSADTWYGYLAPAGTPPAVVAKLNAELNRIGKTPEMVQRLESLGAIPMYGTPSEFATFMRAEATKWGDVITSTKITAD